MNAVYLVIENGVPYPMAYRSFASAKATVIEKHKETIEWQIREAEGGPICSEVDVLENEDKTYLYIEKGIHIYIYKMPVLEC